MGSGSKGMFTKTVAETLRRMGPIALCALLVAAPRALSGQGAEAVVLQIKADQVAAHVSPMLYGLMTEEINYSYDGGLTRNWFAIAASRKTPKSQCIGNSCRNVAEPDRCPSTPASRSTTPSRPA